MKLQVRNTSHVFNAWQWSEKEFSEPTPEVLSVETVNLYAYLNTALSPSNQKPCALINTQVKLLQDKAGEIYYMLKTPNAQYLKISERDYFLWKLMDGQHNLLELALAYQQTYRSFAFERILGLVAKLKQNNFLAEPSINVYSQLERQLSQTRLRRFTSFMQRGVLRLEIPISGLDKPFAKLYQTVGWIGYTRPFFWLSLLLILGGLLAFVYNAAHSHFFLFNQTITPGLNLLWLVLGYALAIFLHELAHGLTLKHFNGEVHSGGMMIFYGMPAFYVNTSDIWMYDRPKRILTSWAGPYMNFLVGGLCAVILWLNPSSSLSQVLFSLAFTCYIGAIFNLNVLLELDGYYMLIDWLEIPQLRTRSIAFIRYKLWAKLWRREKFSREEIIFGCFGILAIGYTSFTLIYAYWSMQNQVTRWFQESLLQTELFNRIGLGLGAIFLATVIIFSLGPLLGQGLRWLGVLIWHWTLDSEIHLSLLWLISLLLGFLLLKWQPVLTTIGPALVFLFSLATLIAISWQLRTLKFYGPAYFMIFLAVILIFGATFPYTTPLRQVGVVASGLGVLLVTLRLLRYIELNLWGFYIRTLILILLIGSLAIGLPSTALTVQSHNDWWNVLTAGFTPAVALAALAVGIGVLQQQWATRFRLAHIGLMLLDLGLLVSVELQIYFHVSFNNLTLGWIALGSGFLYQLAYARASQLPVRQQTQDNLSDEARLWRSALYLLEVTLESVKTTFGVTTVRQLANRLNVATASADWPLRISEELKASRLDTKEIRPLVQTGKLLGQILDSFWQSLVQSCGENYAERVWQRGFDSLHWEERELAEDYLFNYIASVKRLTKPAGSENTENKRLLASLPLFSECTQAELQGLTRACFERKFRSGQIVMKQGAVGDCFYVVKSGQISVWQRGDDGIDKQVNRHERGGYFGELALLNDAPRNATCRADTNSLLLCLRKDDFDLLARRHFALASHLRELHSRLQLLQQIPLFRETPANTLKSIAAQLQSVEVAVGQDVIRQGESGEVFYIIESGQVEILIKSEGQTQIIDRRGAGEFFGEIALLTDAPRSATVRVTATVRLLQLRRAEFLSLISDNFSVKRDLEKIASRRAYSLAKYQRESAS